MIKNRSYFNSPVIVGALGYFVDVYDLILFSVVRSQSLKDLNVDASQLLDVGVMLLNCQMVGLLIGGILWGILGDKRGRISVLYGSILIYSIANLLNAFVESTSQYAVLRFIAGFGLAGELGAAITLVSETMPAQSRGYGTTIVAGMGFWGSVFACLLAEHVPWRILYFIGGIMGLILLGLRFKLSESVLFTQLKTSETSRGEIRLLFSSGERILRFIYCVFIGLPIYFIVGLLIIFSPELAVAQNAMEPISAGRAILYYYIGLSIGDVFSGLLSQWIRSRNRVVGLFLFLSLCGVLVALNSAQYTADYFYILSLGLGFVSGYWAVFVTISAEQFGTNLRSTVTVSTPNLVRGSLVLMTLGFQNLKLHYTIVESLTLIAIIVLSLACIALFKLRETFGIDLDYIEK